MPLTIEIPKRVIAFDERTNKFIWSKPVKLRLEHSLVSVSKWEAKWHKPFLTKEKRTPEELADYVRCMTLTQDVDESVYNQLTSDNLRQVLEYIDDPMTATVITRDESPHRNPGTFTTNETLYYAMFSYGIPKECEKWHLNRLITLIEVFNERNKKQKKMTKADIIREQKAINDARLAAKRKRG